MTCRLARLTFLACLSSITIACGGEEPRVAVPPPPVLSASAASAPSEAPETPPELRLPDAVRPTAAALDLTIVPSQPTFTGRATLDVELTAAAKTVWLHAADLEIDRAVINAGGSSIPARASKVGEDWLAVRTDRAIGPGAAQIVLDYRGAIDGERTQGIYRQAEGQDWFAYTMFEPLDARRAFPIFDEPRFKIPWTITLHVKKEHVALANAPVASEADEPGGMKRVTFAASKPMPSYLVAFIVGPFDVVSADRVGRNKVPLRFAVPRGRAEELRYAKEITPRIVSLLEESVGLPYPYEKLDVAVVPRYNGTMEHPGLVALGQPLTLIKPGEETIQRKQDYANIAVHELAHYWFGNYVTMVWWDDVWLNEALATWMDKKVTDRLEPAWRFDAERLMGLDWAMGVDSLAAARRIREPIRSRHEIAHAFDGGITYTKGAAVLRMFEVFTGEEKFQKAIQAYLERFAWRNATTDDLLGVLAEKTTPAAAPALRTFLDQPGVPIVSADLECKAGGAPRVKLSQKRFLPAGSKGSADQLWHVPVCVKYGGGDASAPGRTCTLLTTKAAAIPLEAPKGGGKGCPEWLMANEGANGYYRVRYDERSLDTLLGRAAKSLSPAERFSVAADLDALTDAGDRKLGAALERLPALLYDADRHLTLKTVEMATSVHPHLFPDELRPNYARFLRKLYGKRARDLGWTERAGEDLDAKLLRPVLLPLVANQGDDAKLIDEARRLAARYLEKKGAVAPDLVPAVLRTAARNGDKAFFDRMLAAARAEKDHRERAILFGALGWFRQPELVRAAHALLLADDVPFKDSRSIPSGALNNDPQTRGIAYEFLKKNWDALLRRTEEHYKNYLFHVPSIYCDEERRLDAEAFFRERAQAVPGGPESFKQALEVIDLCIATKRVHQQSVVEFLKKQ